MHVFVLVFGILNKSEVMSCSLIFIFFPGTLQNAAGLVSSHNALAWTSTHACSYRFWIRFFPNSSKPSSASRWTSVVLWLPWTFPLENLPNKCVTICWILIPVQSSIGQWLKRDFRCTITWTFLALKKQSMLMTSLKVPKVQQVRQMGRP